MNIKELNTRKIKKAIGASTMRYRYHNKNKGSSNFAIDIRGINGQNYELSGDYNSDGKLARLGFGYIYWTTSGLRVPENLEGLIDLLKRAFNKYEEAREVYRGKQVA